MFSGYEVVFDAAGESSFNDDSTINVIIFTADDNSSSHADNRKKNI